MIEMIVVLIMLAILAGLAFPSFIGGLREERLRSSARDVVSVLRIARSRAVHHANPVRVNVDLDEGRFYVTEFHDDREEEALYGQDTRQVYGSEFEERQWVPVETRMARDRVLPEEIEIVYMGAPPDVEDNERDQRRQDELGDVLDMDYVELYPDGTAEETYIVLTNSIGSRIAIRIDDILGEPSVLPEEEAARMLFSGAQRAQL